MTTTHDLAHEFPDMKDVIHSLKTSDNHFRRLFDEYDVIVKQLHRFAEGAGGIADDMAEDLKKRRLVLKDELFAMLKKAEKLCGTSECDCQG